MIDLTFFLVDKVRSGKFRHMRPFVVAHDVHQLQVVLGKQIVENLLHVDAPPGLPVREALALDQRLADRRNDRPTPLDRMVQIPRLEHDPLLPALVRIDAVHRLVQTGRLVPAPLARERPFLVAEAVQREVADAVGPVEVVAEVLDAFQLDLQAAEEMLEFVQRQVAVLEQVVLGLEVVGSYAILGTPKHIVLFGFCSGI